MIIPEEPTFEPEWEREDDLPNVTIDERVERLYERQNVLLRKTVGELHQTRKWRPRFDSGKIPSTYA